MPMTFRRKPQSMILPRSLRRLLTRIPLRWALTVPFVLLIVGATTLVGYLSYTSGQTAVENLGQQLISQTNEQVAQELKSYLQTPLLVNRLNVDMVNQGYLDPQNIPALETALFNRLRQFEQISTVLFVNPQGTFRLVERFPNFFLGIADPPRPDYLKIYPLDDQGNRGSLVHEVKGLDVRRDRPFYRQAVSTGQPGWSPITRYGNSNALTLDAAQPLYDRSSKQLLGVFAVHLRLEYLSQFLRQLSISQSGQVIITDANAALIATSTDESPYSFGDKITQPNQFYQFKIDQSQNDLTRSLGVYLNSRPQDLSTVNQPEFLQFRYRGEPHYIQITPFRDQYGLNWRVITVIPQSYFLAAIQDSRRTTIMLCLLTLGSAIGLGLVAANRLTARFTQLNRISQAFAAGHLHHRLPTNGSIAELNGLAHTFNQMADQIQDSFDRINTALAESKEKFTIIFRTSPESAAITNLTEGQFLEVSDSFLQFFGYSKDEVIGRTALELQIWSDLAQHDQYRELLAQQGSVQNLESQVRTKSGEIKTVLVSAEVRTLEGQDCILVMQRDITERKRVDDERRAVELALQQSEARYRAIVEDQTELISRSLPNATLAFVNDAYCRYFQVRREDVIGKNYRPFIHQLDQEEVAQRIDRLSPAQPTDTSENRVVVNGEVHWVQWSNRLLFDAQGNISEIQSVGRDITELKQTEEALRKSEASLLQAQQIAHLGSWELDLATQKLSWSEELFRIAGLDPILTEPSRAELINMIPVADRDLLETAVERAIAQGTPYEVEHRIVRPDGSMRYLVSKGQVAYRNQQIIKLYGIALDITERKQVEAAFQESQARLAVAHQVAQMGTWEWDLISDRRTWSEMTYRHWGRDVALGDPSYAEVLQMVHPDDRAILQANNQAAIEQGVPYTLDLRVVHPDGSIRYLDSRVEPVFEGQGRVIKLLGTSIDVTERKQTEQALQEREAMLRAIGDSLPRGYIYQCSYEPGKGSRYSYISAGIEQLLGIKPEDVLRDSSILRTVGFEEDIAKAKQIVQDAIANQKPFELIMRNRAVPGKIQWSSIRETPRQLADGRVVWDGVEIDITNLKQIEAALRESEERFRRAFDDAPIGISLVSPTGQFVKVNRSYCHLMGYTPEELFALTFQDLTHPDDLDADLQGFQQMLNGEVNAFQMQKRYITKQGTIIPVLLNAAPIRDAAGKFLYSVGHVQDIRDRLAVERIKDEFISVVSHELRTPLTSIRGALGILGSGVFRDRPQQAEHMLKIAINNSDRLVRLVNDILTLERLQSGKVPLVMEPCQVSDLMQQAIDSVQALADQSSIILSVTPFSATLFAAPDAIVQTLTNLLSNAIKFSTPGGVVWLKAESMSGRVDESMSGRVDELEGRSDCLDLPETPSTHPPIHPSTHPPLYPSTPHPLHRQRPGTRHSCG
ncbi:PAS domain S-box protein [Leptolyngbya ohadii]|uniref:PAS domain S-box protein n=1 Tax=Leptolyngbya ohadii TaxID=1962290 RepID=UPI000B5A0143|nr:PAS domain S-box protein [Leptolyngbya ohadii]